MVDMKNDLLPDGYARINPDDNPKAIRNELVNKQLIQSKEKNRKDDSMFDSKSIN